MFKSGEINMDLQWKPVDSYQIQHGIDRQTYDASGSVMDYRGEEGAEPEDETCD